MALTATGAVTFGPDQDDSRYFSGMSLPSSPAGDFAIFVSVKIQSIYTGDPSSPGQGVTAFARNFTAGSGTGGADCSLTMFMDNHSTDAWRMRPAFRIASGGFSLAPGVTGPTKLALNDTYLIVIQSNAGTVEFWTCGSDGVPVLQSSAARSGSFTTRSLGTWRVGVGSHAHTTQFFGMAAQAFTSEQIGQLATGATDLETVVAEANRLRLWVFDSITAPLAPRWGATSASVVGSMAACAVTAPIIPNAAVRIACTNAPLNYGAVAVNDNGSAPIKTWTGTYLGYTPTALQGRVVNLDGTLAGADWTDLGSFTASGGTWSGTLSIPPGGLYRLQLRDKTDPTITWAGDTAWLCSPVHVSIGQSPHVIFETAGNSSPVVPVAGLMRRGWLHPIRATQSVTSTGQAKLLNTFAQNAGGRGMLLLNGAVVGTSSGAWAARDASVWPGMLALLDRAKPDRVLLSWLNGAAETSLISSGTPEQIKANHDTILANLDADLGSRGIGYRYRMLPHQRDTGTPTYGGGVRTAQYEWARDHAQAGSKVLIGPWLPDAQMDVESMGTAQGGTATTLILDAADGISFNTGAFVGSSIAIVGGTGAGQSRTITAANSATRTVTVAAWDTSPDATSAYVIYGSSPHQASSSFAQEKYGNRYGQDLAYCWGYSELSGQGPVPASARFAKADGSAIDVVFTHKHGTTLRTPNGGTDVSGFHVLQGSTVLPLDVRQVRNATTVRITLAEPLADKTNVKVRYGWYSPVDSRYALSGGGTGGLADLLYDDAGVEPTGGLPAYHTTADLVPLDDPELYDQDRQASEAVNGVLTAVGGTFMIVS